MGLLKALLAILGDGQFHSGNELGAALGYTRSAIWKAVRQLQALGVDVFSVRGKGYRLANPLELLDRERIWASLEPSSRTLLHNLEVHFELDSTNRYLLLRPPVAIDRGAACLAEYQSAGRGRRGRNWISPLGANLYLSLGWGFASGAAQLSGLSLAVAIAVVRALDKIGVQGAGVKWPNDIYHQRRKLAGILLELRGEAEGPCYVVIGIGINHYLSPQAREQISQPCTDIASLDKPVSRNQLAATLLDQLLVVMREYSSQGLAPFLSEWRQLDVFAGQEVCLQTAQETIAGIVQGIDAQGALLLDCAGQLRRFHSGDVSLRASMGG